MGHMCKSACVLRGRQMSREMLAGKHHHSSTAHSADVSFAAGTRRIAVKTEDGPSNYAYIQILKNGFSVRRYYITM